MTLLPPPTDIAYPSLTQLTTSINTFAQTQGYTIVKLRTKVSKKGVVRKAVLKCDRGGKFESEGFGKRQRAASKKIGCMFQAVATLGGDDQLWRLVIKESRHNHAATMVTTGTGKKRRATARELGKGKGKGKGSRSALKKKKIKPTVAVASARPEEECVISDVASRICDDNGGDGGDGGNDDARNSNSNSCRRDGKQQKPEQEQEQRRRRRSCRRLSLPGQEKKKKKKREDGELEWSQRMEGGGLMACIRFNPDSKTT